MIQSFSLAEKISSHFAPQIRRRGERYFREERVASVNRSGASASAQVRGTEVDYAVTLSWDESPLIVAGCECPYFDQGFGENCKHLWALILKLDESGWLAELKNIRGEFFLSSFEDIADEDEFVLDEDPLFERAFSSRPATIRSNAWRNALAGALADDPYSSSRHRAATVNQHRRGWYIIDVERSAQQRVLIVNHAFEQLKQNGEWGSLRFEGLSEALLSRYPDAEDQELLQWLMALHTPEPYRYHYHYRYDGAADAEQTYAYTGVAARFYDALLTRISATGRLACLEFAGFGEKPEIRRVTYENGPDWRFQVVVDDERNGWRLRGELTRGRVSVALSGVGLMAGAGLFIHGDQLYRLHLDDCAEWAETLHGTPSVSIPRNERKTFLEAWWNAPQRPPAVLPPTLDLRPTEVPPHACIDVQIKPAASPTRAFAKVWFTYAGTRVKPHAPSGAVIDLEHERVYVRNAVLERELLTTLSNLHFRPSGHHELEHDYEIRHQLLLPALLRLAESSWTITFSGKPARVGREFDVSIASNIDWFDLNATIDFGGEALHLPQLLRLSKTGDDFYQLPDGSVGLLAHGVEDQLRDFAELGTSVNDSIRFQPQQAFIVDAMLSAKAVDAEVDRGFKTLRRRLSVFQGIKAVRQPRAFHGEMRAYQLEGLAWLRALGKLGLGGCLADDMGLGKTIQVLAMLLGRNRQTLPSLIVVPKSLVFNWTEEAARFAPGLKLLNYTGTGRANLRERFDDCDVVVTTYGLMRRDIDELAQRRFDYVVLDEAQAIKNPRSQSAKAARALAAQQRLVLTGTPVENHLGDLVSLFEFLNPGLLGRSTRLAPLSGKSADPQAASILGAGLRPFILRRTKEQVLADLPAKMEQTLVCELSAPQWKLYAELRDHYRRALRQRIDDVGLAKAKIHVLEALLRLRQAACHPGLIDDAFAKHASAKLDGLMEHVSELLAGGHKALVFSQFTRFLGFVRAALAKNNIGYAYLDGKTRKRQQEIERFQNDDQCSLFLISLKAGGFGLNLTAADYVFVLDPWWNPAVEAQAIDRAHRIGQTNKVFAYRLIAKDTIEEKILELQANKRELANAIVGENNRLIKNLTPEDLEVLLA